MVKIVIEEENKTYQCEECDFEYKEKERQRRKNDEESYYLGNRLVVK